MSPLSATFSRRSAQVLCSLLVCGLVTIASHSAAQQPEPRDPAAAQTLFAEGREALEKGDFELACGKFRESQRLDPGAGTLLNRATCEEKLGRIATAWQLFVEAADQLAPSDNRVAFARKHADALKPRLPRLVLELHSAAPKDTSVVRNGVRMGKASFGSKLPVDPGEVSLVVSAKGYEDRRVVVSIAEGETKKVVLSPGARLPDKPANTESSATSSFRAASSTQRTWGFIVGGIGVAAAGAAVYTGLMVQDKQRTVDENCAGIECNQVGYDAAQDGKTLLVANTVAVAVAALGIGGGLFLILAADEPGPRESVRMPSGLLIGTSGSF